MESRRIARSARPTPKTTAPRRRLAAAHGRTGGSPLEFAHDRVRVVDAAAPGAPTALLHRRPDAGVIRQVGIGREIGTRAAAGKDRVGGRVAVHEVDGAVE